MSRQGKLIREFYETMERERRYMLTEVVKAGGLMPLLMKQRNKQKWSAQDKRELMLHLRHLRHVSPYIAVIVLPGGFAMLPALAWWLDRRRGRRALAQST
ncbi:MAG: hypothetical protein HYY28_04335 [Betaproteobacteria bacterium]|nr:hypothetical protein [Betaproteobacteria bacterium]MBI2959519.1 hypothetical protein [Betaproteobacteria bacterium]